MSPSLADQDEGATRSALYSPSIFCVAAAPSLSRVKAGNKSGYLSPCQTECQTNPASSCIHPRCSFLQQRMPRYSRAEQHWTLRSARRRASQETQVTRNDAMMSPLGLALPPVSCTGRHRSLQPRTTKSPDKNSPDKSLLALSEDQEKGGLAE